MNTPSGIPADMHIPSDVPTTATQIETCVRQHPGGTLLLAAGLGLAAVLIARALTPAPPRNRALCLLEDIQQHLAHMAEESAHAVDKGMNNLGAVHPGRSFDKLSRRFKKMFQ